MYKIDLKKFCKNINHLCSIYEDIFFYSNLKIQTLRDDNCL